LFKAEEQDISNNSLGVGKTTEEDVVELFLALLLPFSFLF
tara:strand:+ start:1672 stop:1791 length:120 start_codon:yes stop_codon:yes gene_type:complete